MTLIINTLLFLIYFQCIFSFMAPQSGHKILNRMFPDRNRQLTLPVHRVHKLRSIEICYESVGCFEIPRHHNPLQSFPEHPEYLQTEFYLFRRDISISKPEVLKYNDDLNITNSKFIPNEPIKVLIHGYMTRWNETGALAGIQAYLDIASCNVILVNWERGAQGPRYTTAAANTELVGRQLALLLLNLVLLGAPPENFHIIGFSLGAHIAACAAQMFKDRGLLIGRITGLDPAGPLFKLDHFRNKRKKLDASDANYVDIIHTDGSVVFTDGFGLFEPLGHVDFFPNGGLQQPGCNDIKNSVVVSHFEKNLSREIACSHIRSYHYFLETLQKKAAISKNHTVSNCEFVAFSCPKGFNDFITGNCLAFSKELKQSNFGILGEDSFGSGIMYLVTKNSPPFCGMQTQIVITISSKTKRIKSFIHLKLQYNNITTELSMNYDSSISSKDKKIYGLVALDYNSISLNLKQIILDINFQRYRKTESQISIRRLYINKIQLNSITGLSWQNCNHLSLQQNTSTSIILSADLC